MEENRIKRPIVIITLGAILGIIIGQNPKSILFSMCLILVYFCSPPNLVGVGRFLSASIRKKSATPAFGYYRTEVLKCKYCRGEQCSSTLRSSARKYIRYIKVIFNKKTIITFIISLIIFSIYTLFLNNKYQNFYKKVGKEVEFQAVVISSPKKSEYYNTYTIKGKTKEFKNKKFILYLKKDISLEYGDKLNIIGDFFEPEGTRNYKGFSYKKYLQTQKIYGTVKAEKIELKSKNNVLLIFKLSNDVRNKIIEQIRTILPEETSGLLAGLMLGDKTYISDDIILDFQKSSLAHILAVSGAHVSYIILGLNYFVLINKMSKKSGYLFTIFSLIAFIFITDFSVSVVRACVMSIILIFSKLFYRKADILNTIAISILILILFNPFSINSVSMQLSYLGTIGVIFVAPVIEKILANQISTRFGGLQGLIKKISVPIAAQITILPIMVKNFGTISLTFLLSNLIAMPLLGISIIGGYLLTIFSFVWLWGTKKICIIFNIFLKALILIAKLCGNLKLSNIYVINPNIITIVIYYIAIIATIYFIQYNPNFMTGTKIVARRGFIFLSKTWKKKISNPDEMRRTYKDKFKKNSNNCFGFSSFSRISMVKL